MDMDDDACYRAIETRDSRFDGHLFVAVTTTGIYCRPFCPAPTPKRSNVRFFRTAAAAQEAGFRPCLRCRPETSPQLAFWSGGSNTVSRALCLIEDGALDNGDVESLAVRLGVGERQLRRLFRRHLGAAPISIAQTRRILLAKQLIQDTKLSMTEVASTAGFGSLRRFNETFKSLFGRPPSGLRRPRSGEQGSGEPAAVAIRLGYFPPYDWDAMLTFLRDRAIKGVEAVSNGKYARTIEIGTQQGLLIVEQADGNCLRIIVRFSNLTKLPAIIARVRRVFDLAADPVSINEHLGRDASLAALVAARPGLRVPGAWDGFELAVRAILGEQTTVSVDAASAGKLVAYYGKQIQQASANEFGLTHLFPTPLQIAHADLTIMPEPVRSALIGLGSLVVADPKFLGIGVSLQEAIGRLRSIPDVAEATAQYIAMRGMREPDAFPSADPGLRQAMKKATGTECSPSKLLREAERWRPWRAYAALHLWSSYSDLSPFRKGTLDGR